MKMILIQGSKEQFSFQAIFSFRSALPNDAHMTPFYLRPLLKIKHLLQFENVIYSDFASCSLVAQSAITKTPLRY